jgi:hypothetical protein
MSVVKPVENEVHYKNVRVRLQRISDMKFFNGWCRHFGDKDLNVELAETTVFEAETDFYLTAYGSASAAILPVRLRLQSSNTLLLQVREEPKHIATSEAVRRSVIGMFGNLFLSNYPIALEVMDVAEKGFGGIIEGAIEKGQIVQFTISTPYGDVIGTGEVRYCRPEAKDSIRHRVGLRITTIGRVESARWNRVNE